MKFNPLYHPNTGIAVMGMCSGETPQQRMELLSRIAVSD